MPAKVFPFKEIIHEKGRCPIDGKEYDKLAVAEIDGRLYLYVIHRNEKGRDKPHYLGPLERDEKKIKRKIINSLIVYRWLAERGYVDRESYKEVVTEVLREVIKKEDDIVQLSDILQVLAGSGEALKEELKKLGIC